MRGRGVIAVVELVCLLGPAGGARAQDAKPQQDELRETMHTLFPDRHPA